MHPFILDIVSKKPKNPKITTLEKELLQYCFIYWEKKYSMNSFDFFTIYCGENHITFLSNLLGFKTFPTNFSNLSLYYLVLHKKLVEILTDNSISPITHIGIFTLRNMITFQNLEGDFKYFMCPSEVDSSYDLATNHSSARFNKTAGILFIKEDFDDLLDN